MTNPFIGEIRAFGFGFAPSGWQQCNGQTLAISQNQALFALLGTTYGGDGVRTFLLPNLQGRVANSVSSGTVQGTMQGVESVTLLTTQIPLHNHNVNAATNGAANATNIPGNTVVLGSGTTSETNNPSTLIYSGTASNLQLAPLASNGSSQPHENRMPSLVMNYCIALTGIFPSRN